MDGFEFALGEQVKDRVTGVTGTVTVRCQYLDGPDRYCIEGTDEVGRQFEDWQQASRLERVVPPAVEAAA